MEADRQQQRDPNRDRRRATNKYIFISREIRPEVDEEQQANTDSATERDPNRGRRRAYQADNNRQIRHVHNTESHKYEDEREHTAADNNIQTTDSDRQQTTDTLQTSDITNQTISDAERGKTRRNQTDAESNVTNITGQLEPFQPGKQVEYYEDQDQLGQPDCLTAFPGVI
ncbi:hypothetical protein Tco_0690642 [Tanacetum coccineum]